MIEKMEDGLREARHLHNAFTKFAATKVAVDEDCDTLCNRVLRIGDEYGLKQRQNLLRPLGCANDVQAFYSAKI